MSGQKHDLSNKTRGAKIPKITRLEPLLTIKQVAELLQVNQRTVKRYIAEGTIPGRRIGGNIRFPESEIKEWINRNPLREY